jgi:hypothetical protein
MSLRFPITLVLSIICLTVPAWADFQAGMEATTRGDYATALREWRPLAEKGSTSAQYNLGLMHANGWGVPQDSVQARQWYEKAAAQGDASAQTTLGGLYETGMGVPQDYVQARQWWEKAAVQGEVSAQFNLGHLYFAGNGVPQDYVQAHKWFNLAAANGNKPGAVLRNYLAKQMTPAQIDARALDKAGNISGITTYTVYVDILPPNSSIEALDK